MKELHALQAPLAVETNQVMNKEGKTTDQEEATEYLKTLLGNVATWKEETLEDFVATTHQLLECDPGIAPSIFNTLLYWLERSPEVASGNIILVVAHLVVRESKAAKPPKFTDLVKNNIKLISHGCGGRGSKVRSCLHECIQVWVDLDIVTHRFLAGLLREEPGWTFRRPPPEFPVPQDEAPSAFDLAMAGMVGRGVDATYLDPANMTALVQNGMREGVEDGWLYIDENGHHKVNIEKALGIA